MKKNIKKVFTLICIGLFLFLAAIPASSGEKEQSASYSNHGISFNYDKRLNIKEKEEKGTITITLEGYEDLLLLIQVMDIPFLSGEDYAESLVKGMRDGMSASGAAVTKLEKITRIISDKKRKGYTFDYTLAGLTFRYAAYGYNSSGKKIAVPIQYPVKNEEKVQPLIEIVTKSLKYED